MPYIQISITTTPEKAELFADALHELDALSITLEDAKDEAIFQLEPETTPLWAHVNVKALFNDNISPRIIINDLKKITNYNDPINYRIEKIADQDWVRLTQQHFKPQCYADQLWICPSWHEQPLHGKVVKIDPGLAFGTGTHPTTNLCLDWLAHNPPIKKTVIDYGCGSGILALAAVTLGAAFVYATDHDEQAIIATTNNAELNNHINASNLTTCYPQQLPNMQADVVVANILANPLISLAPKLAALTKSKGQLLLSGILEHEIPCVTAAYQQNFKLLTTHTLEQWASLALQRL